MKETTVTVLLVFLISAGGYLLGAIKFKGIRLGTAAIFLVGLAFGHVGAQLPDTLQTVGLVLFISSVGLSAGPSFFSCLKRDGLSYLLICLSTAFVGAVLCAAAIRLGGIDAAVAVGAMTGAFTTSPGFGAAKEAFSGVAVAKVAAGYGLIYPFGALGKVLFMQAVPRILHVDMAKERALIAGQQRVDAPHTASGARVDPLGIFPLCIAVVLGVPLGSLALSLPGGGQFSLGTTGGTLIVALLLGHFRRLGPISMQTSPSVLNPIKEIGLALFFSGAGVEGGASLVSVFQEYGIWLILLGLLFLFLPLLAGLFIGTRLLRLPLLNVLGSLAASMTCTPSLAALIETAETDDVASAYASTYPIALILLILVVQMLVGL